MDVPLDLSLKLRARRVLWAQGYYCPLEVDLSHYDYDGKTLSRQPLTDIDVVGFYFDQDLRPTTVIVDCKSGSESEPNRLFWLRGVMDFFHAAHGILLKSKIRPHARGLAPKLGIRVLDEPGLTQLERVVGVDAIRIGIADAARYMRMREQWGIAVPPGKEPTESQLRVKRVYHYFGYLFWMVDEYRNTQSVIERFADVGQALDGANLRDKYLAYVALERLVLSMLRLASEVIARNVLQVTEETRLYLYGGALNLKERGDLMTQLGILNEKLGSDAPVSLEPAYFNELVEIVNKMISYAPAARMMPQLLDAIVLEHVFGSKPPLAQALGPRWSTDAVVLLKRIAGLLQGVSKCSGRLYEDLQPL